jgi:serine-type D-Ala-D-Ala carboxypeptidase (penicillin-binding protein 5/6)
MELQVLQPVSRRRRRRRRIVWRRLLPVIVLGLGALAAGIYVGSRAGGAATDATAPRVAPETKARVTVAPAALVEGPALVRTPVPGLTAPAAAVIDADSGRLVWSRRAHERRQVASTTKIMTALLALRKLRPHDIVQVDKSVPRVPLVREGLRTGEQVETWKLMYALLLYSGNDSALALAIAAGGTRGSFVAEMNDEARRLGLRDTHFRSPSGVVDADNYSTAWDLAALTRVAMRNARFHAIVRTQRKQVLWSAPTNSKIYLNKNLLLRSYPGANGVKTGYTTKSGHCLVASARRQGRSLIAVVLGSRDPYSDATKLLDLGFATAAASTS